MNKCVFQTCAVDLTIDVKYPVMTLALTNTVESKQAMIGTV